MVERLRRSAGATIEACRIALEEGVGVNLAGGTHHAFRDHGEGYCVFNDAAILAHDPTVFTFSIHGARNFPFRKEANDLDIELPDGAGDTAYLGALERGVCHALSAARPDLVIHLAGADPFEDDRLGRLALTK